MADHGIEYIGSFPPPFGGVTIKNTLLYKYLGRRLNISRVNSLAAKHGNLGEALRLLRAIFGRNGSAVIGMSRKWRVRVAQAMATLNKKKAARSIVFVMGGAKPEKVDINAFRAFRRVYVETAGMRSEYEAAGLCNVEVYPNCRERPLIDVEPRPRSSGEHLRCVYFSLVCKEKGIGTVLSAARVLPQLEFHVYGRIDSGYEAEFRNQTVGLSNVIYHGVFDSAHDDVVTELAGYDVHLFPTRCPSEGVPGVIIETKIAGLPTITTNVCRNGELVENGIDGFLLDGSHPEDDAKSTARLLMLLDGDDALLMRMKQAALNSADAYFIDMYIDGIADVLTERNGA